MITLPADTSRPFEWRQAKGGRRYWELYQDDNRLAELGFEKIFSSLATLRTSAGVWQMRRKGAFNMDVLIYAEGSFDPIGIYHPHWAGRKGELSLNERRYDFVITNFWSTRFELVDVETDTSLLSYVRGLAGDRFWDMFKMQATMHVMSTMVSGADLSLLSGFGFYTWVLLQEQTAASVAATSAATS